GTWGTSRKLPCSRTGLWYRSARPAAPRLHKRLRGRPFKGPLRNKPAYSERDLSHIDAGHPPFASGSERPLGKGFGEKIPDRDVGVTAPGGFDKHLVAVTALSDELRNRDRVTSTS